MGILVFIIVLALLVLIHEFGHFIVAKKNGILVEEFGFGFPPRIFGIKIGETLYSINLLPIGGFVKVYGEEYHEGTSVDPKLKGRAFINKKPWQKASVIVAGVIMNFLLGWVLISYLFTQGVPSPTGKVIVEKVTPNSPAQVVGLQSKDSIVRFTDATKTYPITSTKDLISTVSLLGNKEVTLIYKTPQGEEKKVLITPRKNPPQGQGALGITIYEETAIKKYPWYEAPIKGLTYAYSLTSEIVHQLGLTLAKLVTGNGGQVEVTGPVGIAQYTGKAVQYGSNAVIELIALLSLNLAVINILPFPALDGGRLVFIVYEWISRRRVNQKFEQYLNLAGFAILIGLTVLVTANDIIKLVRH
ncbi:site-2 protease family protein [Candidatus Roizmanbacteria bacterium]|nr:site-2 protease family protein [Candidatus Roizmanbacteria bacterium]